MKPFFVDHSAQRVSHGPSTAHLNRPSSAHAGASVSGAPHTARLAIYDSEAAAPRVADIEASLVDAFIEAVSSATYQAARDLGGNIPYTAIREIAENLIHAEFTEPVISILEAGSVIRFADKGPGISDKSKALLPGFSTATTSMKQHIRGVGSGLPIVCEYLNHHRGVLEIEDNLGGGAVITLRSSSNVAPEPPGVSEAPPSPQTLLSMEPASPPVNQEGTHRNLSNRHKRVLSLVLEVGSAGPTLVSNELNVGLSTAHRDLAFLERAGLIAADQGGKRVLTEHGTQYMDELFG